jgi:hypothetical protein
MLLVVTNCIAITETSILASPEGCPLPSLVKCYEIGVETLYLPIASKPR